MALFLAAVAAAPLVAESATPGQVLRWHAPGTQTCHLGDRSWGARDGTCLIPVDLLAESPRHIMRTFEDGRYERRVVPIGSYPYPEQRITLEDDSRVNLSDANAKRAAREREHIDALWPLETKPSFDLPLARPLARLPAGGRFGSRRIINGQRRSPHTGRDYSAPAGTPVLATAAGTVELAEEHFFAGNSVFIDHGDGLISMYFHLSTIDVTEGQRVERQQPIGRVGSTGRSTGPHLHFGLRWHGARVDPEPLFESVESLLAVE